MHQTNTQQSFAIDVSFPARPNTARSLLRLAAVQCFECVKDPTGLPPKARFIATEKSAKLGRLARRKKQRANSTAVASALVPESSAIAMLLAPSSETELGAVSICFGVLTDSNGGNTYFINTLQMTRGDVGGSLRKTSARGIRIHIGR